MMCVIDLLCAIGDFCDLDEVNGVLNSYLRTPVLACHTPFGSSYGHLFLFACLFAPHPLLQLLASSLWTVTRPTPTTPALRSR